MDAQQVTSSPLDNQYTFNWSSLGVSNPLEASSHNGPDSSWHHDVSAESMEAAEPTSELVR